METLSAQYSSALAMPLVRDMQVVDRPREKFAQYGGKTLGMEELLAILLRTGCKGCSALELARRVLAEVGGAPGLNSVTMQSLQRIHGIGRDKAITICTAIELGRRLGQVRVQQEFKDFSNSGAVAQYMMERLRHEKEEHVCVVLLNPRNELIAVETIAVGGLSASLAEQRAVFRAAINHNAASLILVHNHPSGLADPSPKDVEMTRCFQKAGVVMGIPVLDHIIIGNGDYVSLCEKGYLLV